MKKYFLLATTALLLVTSNVMAADGDDNHIAPSSFVGSTSAIMNLRANIQSTPIIRVTQHMSWGTIYASTLSAADLGSFSSSGYTAGSDVDAHTEQIQGKFVIDNPTAIQQISLETNGGSVNIGDSGLIMNNVSYVATGNENEYIITASLSTADDFQTVGSHTGSMTINLDY